MLDNQETNSVDEVLLPDSAEASQDTSADLETSSDTQEQAQASDDASSDYVEKSSDQDLAATEASSTEAEQETLSDETTGADAEQEEQHGDNTDTPVDDTAATGESPQPEATTLFQVDQTESSEEATDLVTDSLPPETIVTPDEAESDEQKPTSDVPTDVQLDAGQPAIYTIVRFVEKCLTGEEPSGSGELTRAQYEAYCGHLGYTYGLTRDVADASLHHLDLLPADVVAAILRSAE